MSADNVDLYKKIIFNIPGTWKTAGITTLSGLLAGLVFCSLLKIFAAHMIQLEFTVGSVLGISLGLYIVPSIISGEVVHRFLPEYPRKWSFFLGYVNMLVFSIFSIILTGANNFPNAWSILWIGLITVFLVDIFIMALTVGYSYIHRIAVLGLIHPLTILAGFYYMIGYQLQIPLIVYLANLLLLPLTGLLLLLMVLTADYLLKSNVSEVSFLGLTSALLKKKQQKIDLGYPTRVEVQTLGIGDSKIAIPWIHPGPLEGFGGGQVTTEIIEDLNDEGKGFFFHFPSTHKSDLSDPEDAGKLLDSVSEPEKYGKASRLLKQEYDGLKFYGRKLEDGKIVYLDTRDFVEIDDFELSIFRDVIDPDEAVLADLHNKIDKEGRQEVWYNTEIAEFLRESLQDFKEELEGLEMHDYRAGTAVSLEDKPVFALVEEVEGQKTLTFGIEGNDVSERLLKMEDRSSEKFDEVMLFTTDTHRSIHEMSSSEKVDLEELTGTVEEACSELEDSEIGFGYEISDPVKLLQEDYHSLIFSINILVRLVPFTLGILYLLLIIWIFF